MYMYNPLVPQSRRNFMVFERLFLNVPSVVILYLINFLTQIQLKMG